MTCLICSKPVEPHYKHPRPDTCFNCNFWLDVIEKVEYSAVIDGHAIYFGNLTEKSPNHCRGCGGTRFVVKFHDGRIVETVDLWHRGAVPDRWRGQLPDDAVFLGGVEISPEIRRRELTKK